jgi:lipid-A-disaccharide synthase
LLLVLPGSRGSEVRYTGPVLVGAAQKLAQTIPGLKTVIVAAASVEDRVRALAEAQGLEALVVGETAAKDDIFAAASVALAASGTVTTEVALQQTPVVVGYRMGWLSWQLASSMLRSKWATLMNIVADAEVAPEFLQSRCTPETLSAAALPILRDPAARAAQVAAQNRALDRMGRGGRPAAEIAADAVEAVMKKGADAIRAPSN